MREWFGLLLRYFTEVTSLPSSRLSLGKTQHLTTLTISEFGPTLLSFFIKSIMGDLFSDRWMGDPPSPSSLKTVTTPPCFWSYFGPPYFLWTLFYRFEVLRLGTKFLNILGQEFLTLRTVQSYIVFFCLFVLVWSLLTTHGTELFCVITGLSFIS